MLIYLNEILIIHDNIFNNEQFDTKILKKLNKQFIENADLVSHMVKPSDTIKAVTTKKLLQICLQIMKCLILVH